MGILNDWGRPPVLVENNNSGQQVLDVLGKIHNYENIVCYNAEGMSKHYNNENRLGIHSHTNTKYRGTSNLRYWINSLNAVEFYDLETLLEINNFIQHPNYTYSKRTNDDFDDRVFALIWGLFILDPSIVEKYFYIHDIDDQGRPLIIRPFNNNFDLLKQSPLFSGKGTIYKKTENNYRPLSYIGEVNTPETANDSFELLSWINNLWDSNPKVAKNEENINKNIDEETVNPVILF